MALMHELAREFAKEYNCFCDAYESFADNSVIFRIYGLEDREHSLSTRVDKLCIKYSASSELDIYLDTLKGMGSALKSARIAKCLDPDTGRRATKIESFMPTWYDSTTLTDFPLDKVPKATLKDTNIETRKKLIKYGRY